MAPALIWKTARLLLLLALILPVGCTRAGEAQDATVAATTTTIAPIATPEPARDFTLDSLTGETVTLTNYRGEWVLLNFWATWCPPCVREMPYLNQLATTRKIQVLGVNLNETDAAARRFVDEYGITFPILMQPDDITLLVYGVRGLPRTFIIAPDGSIARQIIGEINPDQLNAWLDEQGVAQTSAP
ncbi:MAG: TlpA family protein disulfide reductase [Caldilineaceae bacterium]|nr:TlpA family protein disulfide reductase [Caldilineaceae bacterium]